MCPSDQLLNAVQFAVLSQCQHVIALDLELGNFLAPPLYLSLLGLHTSLPGKSGSVQEDVRAGRLRRLFEDYEINPQEQSVCVYAAYLPNRRHSRKVQAFLDSLQLHLVGAAEG